MLKIELDTPEVKEALEQYLKSTFKGEVTLVDFKVVAARQGESRIELSVDMFNNAKTAPVVTIQESVVTALEPVDEDDLLPEDSIGVENTVADTIAVVEEPKAVTEKPLVEAELKPVPGSFFSANK